jgi:hypothetical protein
MKLKTFFDFFAVDFLEMDTVAWEGSDSVSMGQCWVVCKKIFSVSLLFNALLTIACTISILASFYWIFPNWKPFYPFLITGNIFWFAIIAAVINIFPSASIGRTLHTGRFLFHHYIYGALVLIVSAIYVIIFTPVSLFNIFLVNNTTVAVNVGRFFILGGGALLLDDLPDVHERVESALNWLKAKAGQGGGIISAVQLVTGSVSLYLFVAVCFAMFQNPQSVTVANLLLVGTVFVTGATSFIFVKRRVWQKIKP